MTSIATCPKCGGYIPGSDPDNAFAGACPWCMAQGSFDVKAPAEDPRLKTSARLGKYQLTEKLGRGGMGEVWKALDTDLNRWVALKFMKEEDPSNLARLQREAHTAAGLTHPNIAGIYEIGQVEGKHFIAMQFVEGRTLESYPRKNRRLLIQLVRDAARALDHAHRHGIIHRDVKPANIMVEQAEEGPRAIVLDFGLARPIEGGETLSHSGSVMGTPAYMSPQQARGEKLDERTDVYSLGATLYELLTGKSPFEGTGVLDVIKKVEAHEPPAPRKINPHIPRDLETVTMKCLEKDRDRRYGSAKDLADDLSRWLAGDAIMARPASTIYRLRMKLAKRRAVVITAAVGLVASALLAYFFVPERAWRKAAERAQPHLDLARTHLEQMDQLLGVDEDHRGEIEKLGSKARESLLKALQESPNHAESLFEMGRMQSRIRQADSALEYLSKAIEAAPDLGKAYLERAMVHLETYEVLRHKGGGDLRPEDDETRRMRGLVKKDLDQARAWSTEVPKLDFLEGLLCFSEGRYAEAGEKLGEYLRKAPTDWRAWMWRGHALAHAEKGPDSLTSLDRAVGLRPRNPEVLHQRAISREHFKDYAGSLKDSEKLVTLKPKWVLAYMDRGTARGHLRDFAGAIQDFDRAIELDPKCAPVFRSRGIMRSKLGDNEGCIRDCDKAIELDPELSIAYETRGLTWLDLNNADRALQDFSKAIDVEPKRAESYAHRGYARTSLKDFDGAFRDFARAFELDPKLHVLYYNRGVTHAVLGRHEESIRDFDKAIELKPGDARSYGSRAKSRVSLRDVQGALRDYDKSIELDPTFAWAYVGRSFVHIRLRNYDRAIQDCDKAIELDPKDAIAFGNRGAGRLNLRDPRRAIEDLDKAIGLNPKFANAYFDRAMARESLGLHDEAIADYDKAIELDPKDAIAFLNRGALKCDAKGLYDEAIADFSRAIELAPKDGDPWFNRGIARSAKGLLDEAIADFRKSLELTPPGHPQHERRVGIVRRTEEQLQVKGREKEYKEADELFQRCTELLSEAKEYRKAAEGFQKIAEAFPKMPLGRSSAYNACCAYSLLGEKEKALDWFDKAVQLGFVDGEHIDQDSDLDSIRGEPRFKKIRESLKSSAKE